MDGQEHTDRHILLQRHLDELVGNWIIQTGGLPSTATVMDLMKWANEQTIKTTEVG